MIDGINVEGYEIKVSRIFVILMSLPWRVLRVLWNEFVEFVTMDALWNEFVGCVTMDVLWNEFVEFVERWSLCGTNDGCSVERVCGVCDDGTESSYLQRSDIELIDQRKGITQR